VIYLDYNATTPTDPRVVKTMLPYFHDFFANPSSIHGPGQEARKAVEQAREKLRSMSPLLKEKTDSEAIRFLNYGIDLPKSEKQAKEFVEKYADFKNTSERIMFSVETLSGDLVGGINIHLRYCLYELHLQKCNVRCIEINKEAK